MDEIDTIDVRCTQCGRLTRYPALHMGKAVSCPACSKASVLPMRPAKEAPPSAVVQPAIAQQAAAPAEKVLFICTACSYRARIPAQYVGMAVRCPSCDAAQIATPEDGGVSTGLTVQISRMPSSATAKTTTKTMVRPGNILFTCAQCNFAAQLAKHYLGKAIRCPGCHAPQVVADSASGASPITGEASSGDPALPPVDPRFICISCGYRARIPGHFLGLAVSCPKCETVQIASPEDSVAPATGDTVKITNLKTAQPIEPGTAARKKASGEPKIAFRCTQCGYNDQVGESLLGIAITCPGCQSRQVVGASADPVPPALALPSSSVTTSAAGNGDKVRFTCSACGFKARIPAHYAGETIHCPACNVVQLVISGASGMATGKTQILNVVQTVALGPEISITPSMGNVALADSAVAAPAAIPAPHLQTEAKGVQPLPVLPQPPVTPAPKTVSIAAPRAAVEEQLFSDPTPARGPETIRSGKVVRRSQRTPIPTFGDGGTNDADEGATPFQTDTDKVPSTKTVKATQVAAGKTVTAAVGKPASSAGVAVLPSSQPVIPAKGPAPAPKAVAAPAIAQPSQNLAAGSALAADMARKNLKQASHGGSKPMVVMLLVLIVIATILGLGYVFMRLQDSQKQLKTAQDNAQAAQENAKAVHETLVKLEADMAKDAATLKAAQEKADDLQKQLDAQKAAQPKADEAPKADVIPAADAPKTDATTAPPAPDAPKADAPTTPTADAPKADAPKADVPLIPPPADAPKK